MTSPYLENKMATFNITSRVSGIDLGNYAGGTKEEALDAMARDAGYKDYVDCCEQTGVQAEDLVATRVH